MAMPKKNVHSKYSNPYDRHLGYRQTMDNLGPRFLLRAHLTLKFLPLKSRRILDVGCGDGTFTKFLHTRGISADGIDGSKRAIEICKNRFGSSDSTFTCCFIDEFTPATPYDLLICAEVLEHIEDDRDFLSHLHRLCSNGGALVLSTPLDMRLWSRADEQAGHFRRYSKQALFGKLGDAGFTVDDYVIWGYPITRYLTPIIRKYQTQLLNTSENAPSRNRNRNRPGMLKPVLRYLKYAFFFDNFFNFTEKGIGIIVRATRS